MNAPVVHKPDGPAEASVLLVACDFDGTLAEITGHPAEARPDPETLECLLELARLPRTYGAVISGRARAELESLLGSVPGLTLVGSHGAEFEGQGSAPLDEQSAQLLERLHTELVEIARACPGTIVERKPSMVALHYRMAEESAADRAVRMVLDGPGGAAGIFVLRGSKVIELSLHAPDKAGAIRRLRHRFGAHAVVFAGDDATDELAVAELGGECLSVGIGPNVPSASVQLDERRKLNAFLRGLAAQRRAWLGSIGATPIDRHAVVSDQRTLAVIDDRATVVWMCLPQADSGPLFGALVGGPEAGFFEIVPEGEAGAGVQEYLGDSMILRTAWASMSVTDYLECAAGRAYQRAGRTDLIRVIEGRGRAIARFAPRIDFSRHATALEARAEGLFLEASQDPCVLVSPGVAWNIEKSGRHHTASAAVDLSSGPVVLELRWGTGSLSSTRLPEPARRARVERFWSGWAHTLQLPSVRPDLVRRSALILKALCHGPAGSILAAATTSLPEQLGGSRNWDYRFCWPRDSCLSAAALVRLGSTGIALKLLDWIAEVVAQETTAERLRPIYTVTGGHLWPEAEISEMPGYALSRPVRIGNAAEHQVQLDVFGPIVDLLALLADDDASITPEQWRLAAAIVSAVQARWREPDHGIWEVRGAKRHHVHTKIMCWQAAVRGALIARKAAGLDRPDWLELAGDIRRDVVEHGWSARAGAYTAFYGSDEIDAASLWVVLGGLLPPDDPRAVSTVRAVQRALQEGPTVFRYRNSDGLPGVEGGFHICAFWLVEALWMIGARSEASDLFARITETIPPTGLLSEQYDPRTGVALGNFPQAYSHLGLINAAVRLSG